MVEIGGRPILWHIMKIYSAYGVRDLPLNFHPAAIRASADVTPFGAISVPA
jgi:NDP-sugar pyrophosphorylase family protein